MSVFEEYLQKLEQSLPHISADELKQWQEDKLDFVLVDVRQAEEFAEGYIPGAMNLPRHKLEANIEALLADPKQLIIVHCGSRGRSQLVCHSLRDMGLDCSVLLGGYQAWLELDTEAAA